MFDRGELRTSLWIDVLNKPHSPPYREVTKQGYSILRNDESCNDEKVAKIEIKLIITLN